jgi:undecaprenyl-diphosphatase
MQTEEKYADAMRFPPLVALKIGVFQSLALIPGMSRSGSTIVGALLVGCERRAAAEVSFFLAMPTMLGAFTYDLYKNRALLSFDDGLIIALGFVAAFVSALFVLRWLLDYVARNGFALFALWRIVVGLAGLAALYIYG